MKNKKQRKSLEAKGNIEVSNENIKTLKALKVEKEKEKYGLKIEASNKEYEATLKNKEIFVELLQLNDAKQIIKSELRAVRRQKKPTAK